MAAMGVMHSSVNFSSVARSNPHAVPSTRYAINTEISSAPSGVPSVSADFLKPLSGGSSKSVMVANKISNTGKSIVSNAGQNPGRVFALQ